SPPIMPSAPALFSTTIGWPRRSASAAPTVRPIGSAEPPGGKPMIRRTGLFGYCAAALPATSSSAARNVLIRLLLGQNYTGRITKRGPLHAAHDSRGSQDPSCGAREGRELPLRRNPRGAGGSGGERHRGGRDAAEPESQA